MHALFINHYISFPPLECPLFECSLFPIVSNLSHLRFYPFFPESGMMGATSITTTNNTVQHRDHYFESPQALACNPGWSQPQGKAIPTPITSPPMAFYNNNKCALLM